MLRVRCSTARCGTEMTTKYDKEIARNMVSANQITGKLTKLAVELASNGFEIELSDGTQRDKFYVRPPGSTMIMFSVYPATEFDDRLTRIYFYPDTTGGDTFTQLYVANHHAFKTIEMLYGLAVAASAQDD